MGGDLKALIGLAQAARALELSEEELVRRAREQSVLVYRRQRAERWEEAIELDDLKTLREEKPSEAVQGVQRDLARVRQELYDALGLYDEAEERREDDQRRLRELRREVREHRRENAAGREESEARQRALVEKLEAQRREFAASRRELAEVESREATLRRRWTEEAETLRNELEEATERAAEIVAELRSQLSAEGAARAALEGEVDELRGAVEQRDQELAAVRAESERAQGTAVEERERALAAQREAIEEEMARLRMEREAAVAERDEIEEVAARAKREALESDAKLARHVEAKDKEIASMEESAARWREQCLAAEKCVEEADARLEELNRRLAAGAEEREAEAVRREEALREEVEELRAGARRSEAEAAGLRPKLASLGEELARERERIAHLETELKAAVDLERATQRYADRTEEKLRALRARVAGTTNGHVAAEEAEDSEAAAALERREIAEDLHSADEPGR